MEHNINRLAEDHLHAGELARALAGLPGVGIKPDEVDTNIVVFDVKETHRQADEVVAALKSEGVLVVALGRTTLRAVTHLDVSSDQIDQARAVWRIF